MEAVEFWAANSGAGFKGGYTTWSARYIGTGSDYERYRAQIDNAFISHATRRGLRVVAITTVKDGDGFIVYATAEPNG